MSCNLSDAAVLCCYKTPDKTITIWTFGTAWPGVWGGAARTVGVAGVYNRTCT